MARLHDLLARVTIDGNLVCISRLEPALRVLPGFQVLENLVFTGMDSNHPYTGKSILKSYSLCCCLEKLIDQWILY